MSRMRWIARMDEGVFRLIPEDEYVPVSQKTSYQVLEDTIPLTWHPVTGEYCSSRTGMIRIAKQHGLEELGNERFKPKKPERPDRAEIRERLIHAYDRASRS